MRVALALLGAARGHPLTIPMLIGAAEVLALSPNAMRIAISRLASRGDVITRSRGAWALAPGRVEAFEHVRQYRTGFATRVPWRGGFVGVLTAELPRRSATLVRRRHQALELAGFRPMRHGLYVRPDNLRGGLETVATHLARLGLDRAAELIGVTLAERQRVEVARRYQVASDGKKAVTLTRKVEALLSVMSRRPPRLVAASSFWLGDEVLRFLARDPLLPEQLADPAPRRKLAAVMSALDVKGLEVWRALLEELERNERRTRASRER